MRAFVCNWKQIAVGDLKAVTTGSRTSDRSSACASRELDGTYVALATCGTENVDPATLWISDYPGLSEVLATVPWTAYTVQQASPIATIGESTPVLPDLGSLPGTGSAG